MVLNTLTTYAHLCSVWKYIAEGALCTTCAGEKPSTWDPIPIDPATRSEVVCHLVDLQTNRREYKYVSQVSHKTMKPGAFIEGTVMFNQNL